ncbi:hypothetical protein [Lactiplantibacillus paraxiangfangensis]|uniref:hypothetical protein n=1 Tax=Lactiplantibacillus paraxiangfangensis TaxID=3076224 RepID=UPI0030C7603F
MAKVYQPIVEGQSNWVEPLNTMLEALAKSTDDSGWIDLPLINGFLPVDRIGKTQVRKIGKTVTLQLSLSHLTPATSCLKLPTGFVPNRTIPTFVRGLAGAAYNLSINSDGSVLFESKVDGNYADSDYVGDILMWVVD